ncbi:MULTISPECIES: hypothetical protein [Burkholderia]|uniref:hypothetical protein n=2 Tax=Burkholderiaceae TaxID=119060 RepID=UPI0015D481FB|nr:MULTISPECIES: hypothetical protein [Burkholderia]MDF3106270.1 hypothetical protein [Burkholderia semiarida]
MIDMENPCEVRRSSMGKEDVSCMIRITAHRSNAQCYELFRVPVIHTPSLRFGSLRPEYPTNLAGFRRDDVVDRLPEPVCVAQPAHARNQLRYERGGYDVVV